MTHADDVLIKLQVQLLALSILPYVISLHLLNIEAVSYIGASFTLCTNVYFSCLDVPLCSVR